MSEREALISRAREYQMKLAEASTRWGGVEICAVTKTMSAETANLAWDAEAQKAMGLEPSFYAFLHDAPRSIGPLVKYYRATGYAPALQLCNKEPP